jgi:perosamine synthetase
LNIEMAGPWLTKLEEDTVLDAVRNGWYGPKKYWYVETFEAEFARYHGRKYALMTPNCTTAIHLLLLGLGIKASDEVIVPECTWIATAAPITHTGATTVFADIDPVHWCITPQSLEAAITPRTRAVIAVDLYGNMPDVDGLAEVAKRRGIAFIEDAAEALGSVYKGVRAGKFGIASVFSFHRTKTLTTGEGGMLLLDDDALFKRCKFLRDHGRDEKQHYFNTEVAYKYMPFNVQAALGYAQFKRVEELVQRKRWILERYKQAFAGVPDLHFNPEPPGGVNGVWCSTLVFGKSHKLDKATVMDRLQARGLPVRPFFYPLSMLPAFPGCEAAARRDHSVAYDVSNRGINLPSPLNITEAEIAEYAQGVRSVIGA